jgi:actin-related protein 8
VAFVPSSGAVTDHLHRSLGIQFEVKIDSLVTSFRERMKFYGLRVTRNAASVASAFNESFKPEIIPDSADPYRIDWITEAKEDVLVGEKV